MRTVDGNKEFIARFQSDWDLYQSRVQKDKEGNILNPITLKGVEGSAPKRIAAKLAEINEKACTRGEYFNIGTLYGFNLVVKTESSSKDLYNLSQNKFFVMGESGMKYSYNNGRIAADSQLASMNFLNALEKILSLIEKFRTDTEKIAKDIPVLQEVLNGSWKKEEQLKGLKTELTTLDRKIQLPLKPIEQSESPQEEVKMMQDGEGTREEMELSCPIEPAVAAPLCQHLCGSNRPGRVAQLHSPRWKDYHRLWLKRCSLSDRRYKQKDELHIVVIRPFRIYTISKPFQFGLLI